MAVPCGLLIAFAWVRFVEQMTLTAGLVWCCSLLLAVVPVIAANITKSK